MEEFWILIMVAFIATFSLEKAESVKVKLEETPLKTFDEIFGVGWWDKGEAEDLKTPPTDFGQNVHHQIDRQNTQIRQIEPNSIDQNAPLTESDHSDKLKNGEKITSNKKRKIIDKFHAIKDEFKQKGKYSKNKWVQIERKIAKHLKVSRSKIYKWKKEFGLSRKMHNFEKTINERKILVEKFDQMKANLTRAGFKNPLNELDKTIAKELGLSDRTIYNWKRELGQTTPKHIFPHNKQKELMKRYYEIKDKNPKIIDKEISKMLKIGRCTLYKWKKQFKRQQLQPNSVDGHSVEEYAIGNSNPESF